MHRGFFFTVQRHIEAKGVKKSVRWLKQKVPEFWQADESLFGQNMGFGTGALGRRARRRVF